MERASHDLKAVITTYVRKHNHDVPVARGVGYRPTLPTNSSNNATTMTINNESGMSYHNPNNSMMNASRDSNILPSSETRYTLEMLHNQGSFGFSEFENPIRSSYMNRQPNWEGLFSKDNDKPKDENFFDSILQ